MNAEPTVLRYVRYATEAILLMLACLTPWAYGGVEAWAEFLIFSAIAALSILNLVSSWGQSRLRALTCLPALSLMALALLAMGQATPIPASVLHAISPPTANLRDRLQPAESEIVSGDQHPPVPLAPPTISQDPEATFRTAARLAAGWVLFQSVFGLARGPAPLRRFAIGLAVNCTVMAVFSLVQMLSWNGKIYWVRETPSGNGGPFVCHNHLAAYLNLGLGFTLAFLLARRTPSEASTPQGLRLFPAYGGALIVVGIVASLSRSGFLAMSLAMLLGVLALRPKVHRLGFALVGIAVLVPLFLFALGTSMPYQERLSSLIQATPYSERFQIWGQAIRIWPIYPVLGTGLGSFEIASLRFYQRDFHEIFAHAENEYIEWLVEGGLLGVSIIALAVAGVIRLARSAVRATTEPGDQALLLGAIFSLLTLTIHSLGDFAMHIPAVAITAVLIAAHLCKVGIEAAPARTSDSPTPPARIVTISAGGTTVILGLALAALAYCAMLSESEYAGAGLNMPGVQALAAGDSDADLPRLERIKTSLQQALRYRPDWAEGHWKLGLTYLSLYRRNVFESFQKLGNDPAQSAVKAQVLWLFNKVHAPTAGPSVPIAELLSFDAVRRDLVPAARCFLEARRCCPILAQPHAHLATLDYLLERGDSANIYLRRALRLAGADRQILDLTRTMALQVRDLDLFIQSSRRLLSIDDTRWESVADMSVSLLSPTVILNHLLPTGRHALWFAQRLYSKPEGMPFRKQFLERALLLLPNDERLTAAEKLHFQAQAWFLLDDRVKAEEAMNQALALEPANAAWRADLVNWMIAWGRIREAHDQALVGKYFAPDDPASQSALERAAEALVNDSPGNTPPPPRIE